MPRLVSVENPYSITYTKNHPRRPRRYHVTVTSLSSSFYIIDNHHVTAIFANGVGFGGPSPQQTSRMRQGRVRRVTVFSIEALRRMRQLSRTAPLLLNVDAFGISQTQTAVPTTFLSLPRFVQRPGDKVHPAILVLFVRQDFSPALQAPMALRHSTHDRSPLRERRRHPPKLCVRAVLPDAVLQILPTLELDHESVRRAVRRGHGARWNQPQT